MFEIDSRPYLLAVEHARLALEQANLTNEQLDASISAARATIEAREAQLHQQQREMARIAKLYQRKAVSTSTYDQNQRDEKTALADLNVAKANLQELLTERGYTDGRNVRVSQAQNQLESARLDLSYTRVTAKKDGVVSNLQLQPGAMAQAGQALVAMVENETDVIADFREKSLRGVDQHSRAIVVFDSHPGHLYQASVKNIDAGVSSGQFAADGLLATPTNSNRWVRDAQRLRLHLQVHDMPQMASGARATVQLLPNSMLPKALAYVQIYVISLLHFIY